MLYIDVQYATLLSSKLRNFKQKSSYLWNYSCPICGDSEKSKLKARGYIYRHSKNPSDLLVKCHKCGYSTSLGNFIKYLDPELYTQYALERYKSNVTKFTPEVSVEIPEMKSTVILEDSILEQLKRIDTLKETHPAVKYLIKRKIPRECWYLLYFTTKFKKYVNSIIPDKFKDVSVDHPRMIIPFFNAHGKVFGFQGRAYDDKLQRYFIIKIDDTEEKIFGLERVDYSKRIFVVEGALDSLFLPNCIAVSGASFDTPIIKLLKTNATLIMDREPRHVDVCRQLNGYIKKGYSVAMLPDTVHGKDINEMILNGMSQSDIVDVINRNTFTGMEAQLKFSQWRKV